MDRGIVYPAAIPLDTDFLGLNRNVMVALAGLLQATLGTGTVADGLACTPTAPASLTVVVGPGSITQLGPLDQNAYGSLAADAADQIVKMGINLAPAPFTLTPPSASGQAVNYLIEAAFEEADANPLVLPYANAANPAQPYAGPDNSGVAQNTSRIQRAQLQLKAGAAAALGSQATPAVDAGWVGLHVVTVNYGQTQILAENIATIPAAPFLPFKLPALRPGFAAMQSFTASGSFTVPAGVSQVRVRAVGGGGSGGYHASIPGGGGGGGGRVEAIITGLVPGQAIPVMVGAGGAVPASPAIGGQGGTSSFGTFISATGGGGGGGGTAAIPTTAGGTGGAGLGGAVNWGGSYGTDGISQTQRGGDGAGPGGGRGVTGALVGIAANGYGGGGGGGGSTAVSGGTGYQGGPGGSGIVIVEY